MKKSIPGTYYTNIDILLEFEHNQLQSSEKKRV